MWKKAAAAVMAALILAAAPVTVRADEPTTEACRSFIEKEAYRDTIPGICEEVGAIYDICPELLESIVWQESRGEQYAVNGECKGLCQINERWHRDRMQRLGVMDIWNKYGNVLLCADYLSELYEAHKAECNDMELALMLYSMNPDNALRLYREGKRTAYVRQVLSRSEELERGRGK